MIGALLTAAAPVIGGALGFAGNERSNAANARQAQMNRDFQERMSNTAYQRATADMRAAGLNPALAYQQGGAGTPGGAQATMTNSLAGGGGAAEAGMRIQEIQNMKAVREATQAQTEKTRSEAGQIQLESMARLQEIQERIRLMGEQVTDHREFRPLQKDVLFGTGRAARMQSYKTQSETRFLDESFEQRLAELRAVINATTANARAANARAGVDELMNRPMLLKAWERFKNDEVVRQIENKWLESGHDAAEFFKNNRWSPLAPFFKYFGNQSFRGRGGGQSW